MKKTYFSSSAVLLLVTFIFCLPVFAEEAKDTQSLVKCAGAADSGSPACLEGLKDIYFKDNKYTEFVELLKGLSLSNKSIEPARDYYIALSRYSQLKYLEEAKAWDEYFAKGNDYRDDIVNAAQKAIEATSLAEPVQLYSRLLLFQFHKDQQDAFAESALTDLLASASAYAQAGGDIKTVKDIADKISSYGEKGKAKELYKIYAQELSGSQIQDQGVKDIAANFYKEGNLELAENVYDIYINRISTGLSAEELTRELTGIAKDFVYQDNLPGDPAYAEKLFQKIEETGGREAFDEELMYLRGFNLEKSKAYAQAKDIYVDFIIRFPRSSYKDKLIYKTGLIYTYILRDLKTGRDYFRQLNQKLSTLPYDLASLYQLGLLSQWEGSLPEAKSYYDRLLQKIGDTDPDRLALAQERLKEINQGAPIEHNLKMGLDTALKDEYANLDMSKLSLTSSYYQPAKNTELELSSVSSLGPTGCLQVELQYLWSGDLGGVEPAVTQPSFKTSYKSAGTELITLVLVSPEGVAERAIDLIDVH
ncbi:MAG: hypothetical protein KA022_00185 [Candidatus Omnitrophica bacterium]|nr:hypothetical protein [Candidatus Omnitrophota bacterium]